MNPRVEPIAQILRGNAALFGRAVVEVDADAARDRPAGRANHIGFILCHVLDARGWTASFLGADGTHAFSEQFNAAEGIDDLELPPLDELAAEFAAVTDRLLSRLEELTDEDLERQVERAFPFSEKTVISGLTFLAWHESYHVGQLALLRSYLGLSSLTGF